MYRVFHRSFFYRRGQVALTTVFLIGSFIIIIALTLAFLSISAISSNYAVRSADRAFSVASAGIQDATLKLIRNNDYNESYVLDLGGDLVNVQVTNTRNIDNQAVVTASSTVGSGRRAIQAVLSIVSSTGQVNVISWRQI